MQTPAKADAMIRALNDFQLFDLTQIADAKYTENMTDKAVWQTRTWLFDEIDRRGMLVWNEERGDFDIVLYGVAYDSVTFAVIA